VIETHDVCADQASTWQEACSLISHHLSAAKSTTSDGVRAYVLPKDSHFVANYFKSKGYAVSIIRTWTGYEVTIRWR
jgi:hypothetical protein